MVPNFARALGADFGADFRATLSLYFGPFLGDLPIDLR